MFDDLISSLSLVAKKCNSVITVVVKGFFCNFQGRIDEIYGREASGKTTLGPSYHQGSSKSLRCILILSSHKLFDWKCLRYYWD